MTESNTDVFDMMKDEILANAEEKAKEILNQANQIASELSEDVQKRAGRVSKEIIEQAKKEADLRLKREIAKAKLTARSDTLKNKEEIINDVFDQAQKKLIGFVSSAEYVTTLNNLITEAAIGLNGGDLKIKIQTGHGKHIDISKIQQRVMQQTGTTTTLSVIEDNLRSVGGAIVTNSDETIRIDNTFEARLRRMRQEIRTKIAKILFE
ncbi:V-type ATP synthase subunit E [Candidatus Borrarchaeum sp.]|uniref:V-type ATP synthase subunit E n=1 Tax=Candidatus Borrarchaeum sp. TaxID=2846742 RepID=UPI00257C509A|nr:V-type ATP synthase subunit E family protein [Candidatus Borrarchaeum sp.]